MIKIIPKTEKKSSLELSLSALAAILLIASMLSYGLLIFLEKKIPQEIKEIEQEISKAKAPEVKETEKYLRMISQKINTFSEIFNEKVYPSKFLALGKGDFSKTRKFSTLIHPKVQILNFSLDLEKNELLISGITQNYITLEQQKLIFENEKPLIKKVSLKNFGKRKDKKMNFTFEIEFDPKVFRE